MSTKNFEEILQNHGLGQDLKLTFLRSLRSVVQHSPWHTLSRISNGHFICCLTAFHNWHVIGWTLQLHFHSKIQICRILFSSKSLHKFLECIDNGERSSHFTYSWKISLSFNSKNQRMPVSNSGPKKKATRRRKNCSVNKFSALLWAKPLTQLAIDTTAPGSWFYVTNHSKHLHGQHMLSKISIWHLLYLNGGALQCLSKEGSWAEPLLTSHGRSQTHMARDSPRTRWECPSPLCLSLLQLTGRAWAVCLSWKNQPGVKPCFNPSDSPLQRPVWTKSWARRVGQGWYSVVTPSLKMELKVPPFTPLPTECSQQTSAQVENRGTWVFSHKFNTDSIAATETSCPSSHSGLRSSSSDTDTQTGIHHDW